MKKTILAFAAVMIAFAVQAASLNWQTWGYINDGSDDSDWITGGQAYLIQVTDTSTFAVAADLSITGGSIVDSRGLVGGTAAGTWNDTSSLVSGSVYQFAILMTTEGSGITTPTSGFYGLDMNGDNAGSFYEVTWDANTGVSISADEDIFNGVAIVETVTTGTTPPEDDPTIPEPTVLALLALGAAGLALKRKVA